MRITHDFLPRVLAVLVVSLLVFAAGRPVAAQDDESNPLAAVRVHPDSYRRHVEGPLMAVWRGIRDFEPVHGLEALPAFDLYVHSSPSDAAAASGFSDWDTFGGIAYVGRAHVLEGEYGLSKALVAHEAFHVVQYHIAGSGNLGHACIEEGAAAWYEWRYHHGTIDWDHFVAHEGRRFRSDPPPWTGLVTTDQWKSYVATNDDAIYTFCMVVFDLLEKVHGRTAYFEYLGEQRRGSWMSAFEKAFGESFDEFVERVEVWFDSEFTDWTTEKDRRLAAERAEQARLRRLATAELLTRLVYGCASSTAATCVS
ncbi:MAG TPA: hypothetical protein VK011_01295 [Acidimicrobiia bacterium]|nr:hypothetical protein [Acidimicrobiia bacterium]